MTSSTKSSKPIGLIGAGVMGQCMVPALVEHGYDVLAYDLNRQALRVVEGSGAKLATSPKDVADACDFVILSLPGSRHCQSALFDEGGVSTSSNHGIVINTSTIEREASQEFSEKLGEAWNYVDAPILGRPSAVGKWLMPAGGNPEAIQTITPVLESFASKVVPVGAVGNGNALKALNQLMFTVINAITSEVLALADASGLSKEVFYETVAASSAGTVSGLFKELGRNIVDDHFEDPVFTIDLLIKDTSLGLSLAKQLGKPSLLGELVQLNNQYAQAKGYGSLDTSILYKVFRDR